MKTITLCLMVFSLLMLASCGGGGGGGSGGSGGPSLPAEVELSISPFDGGLRIQWHNLPAIEKAGGIYIHLNLTSNDSSLKPLRERIAIETITNNDNSYELDRLPNDAAYRLVEVRVELPGNVSRVIDSITWSEPWQTKTNALDNNGGGIVVGVNHDGDGRADSEDEDDDNDGRPDTMDPCRLSEVGGSSTNRTLDYDEDGCRNDEDTDGDNDGVLNKDEVDSSCVLDEDCDDDGVDDGNEMIGCVKNPDCDSDGDRDDVDIDIDGDGLIEVGNAEELNAVRFVLNGTGFKETADAGLVTLGCGDGKDISKCSGYELVRDISLTDYIARTNATAGWQPIAHDTNTERFICSGDKFTGTFDGNGFEVRGLFINRLTGRCLGLFGQASGTIRHLGVIVDRIGGSSNIGGLAGSITEGARIIQSYAVNGEIVGNTIGGLVGTSAGATRIIQSYAVNGIIISSSNVGGLLGFASMTDIIQSYAVIGRVERSTHVVIANLGGLVGHGPSANMTQSYSVSGILNRGVTTGGLIGQGGTATDAYWDAETSGRNNDSATGSLGQTTTALRSPTDYEDIYSTWDDGVGIAGINDNTTIWCDEDQSGMIESDEMRNSGDEDNRVWDFGTASDYPALRCTGDSLTDQRAWWYLNTTSHKPQLNQTYLDAYLKKD